MEKILIALDGPSPCKESLEFGIYLSRLTHSRITGIFLENQPEDEHPVMKKMYDGTYMQWEVDGESKARREKMRQIEEGIKQFKSYYANHDIPTAVHSGKGIPLNELLNETRYADLLVIDAEYGCQKPFEQIPSVFVEEILAKAECPVVLASGSFGGVEEIIFAWDGSQSATFAIKLFTYLFPQLNNKKVIIVQVKEENKNVNMDRAPLREWLEHHYKEIHWQELQGDPYNSLFGYILNKRKAFIILGAYGRSSLSGFFWQSHAKKLIKAVAQPIFIAHC